MDSLSVDELAQKKDRWYRIVEEMLAEAGVAINGPRAWDIRVHNPALFKRILQEGSLGFGESYGRLVGVRTAGHAVHPHSAGRRR